MINKTCSLILQDLYFYDFKSAYPRILDGVDWDFGDIDLDDKELRNISIGKAQKNNENLSAYLMTVVDNLLNYYLTDNNIPPEDVIVTQRDGFILNNYLTNTDKFMKLDFRGKIDLLIITPDRQKYLAFSDNVVTVKGIRNRYDSLNIIYNRFSNLNFYDKKVLFKQLDNLKTDILNCSDKKLYMIELNNEKYIVSKSHGTLKIANESLFTVNDIDTKKYFDNYFSEFFDSIFLTFY